MKQESIVREVQNWVDNIVVDLNLCPFARRELVNNKIRFVVTEASTEVQLLDALQTELEALQASTTIETTLLIHPNVLQDFRAYNQFLSNTDALLVQLDLEGVFQIASFHPDYQFAGTTPKDVENYTNRSPYPILHILREESVARAIASHPDPYAIPERNIKRLNSLGLYHMEALLYACFMDRKST